MYLRLLISFLILILNPREIFPRTLYTSGEVRSDSAGAIMREQAKAKRLALAHQAAADVARGESRSSLSPEST